MAATLDGRYADDEPPYFIIYALLNRLLASMHVQKIDKRRVVSEEEGQRWAEDHGFLYFETSAYSGANVGAVFSKLFEKALPTTDRS